MKRILSGSCRLWWCIAAIALLFTTDALAETKKLSLSLAIKEALYNNLNLKLDKQRLVEAMGATRAEEGVFDTILTAQTATGETRLPQLIQDGADEESTAEWSAGLQKTFTPGTLVELDWENNRLDTSPQTLLIDPAYSSGLTLRISQPLLQGFGTENQTAQIRAARKQEDARAMVVESTSADLAATTISSYWDLVFSYQDIEVQKISLELAEKLLQETKDRIDAGQLAQVELFRPQSEVARREERLISAERAIGLAEDRVKILLNSKEWEVIIEPTDLPSTRIQQFDSDVILSNTLRNRPDLKAAKFNQEAAEILVRNAEDRTRSSLELFGALGISGTDDDYANSLDNLASDTDSSWQIGLAFSRPLDNSFAKGRLIQARASLDQAKTNAEIIEQEIRRAVRSAMRDVRLAIKNLDATRKTSLASLKGLEAEQVKFEAGRGTTLDVLVAQETYAAALSQEKLAAVSYAKTLAELDRIQGIIRLPEN